MSLIFKGFWGVLCHISVILLQFVKFFGEFFEVVVGVDDLAYALAGVSLNAAAHRLVEAFFLPHCCEGMARIVGEVLGYLAFFVFV